MAGSSTRDTRLDVWRGLCLVDMVLVHLAYEGVDFGRVLGPLIGEYTRLAAGGFVFVSGLSIGALFLPRARDATTRAGAYRDLRRRAAYVLGVHWIAAAAFLTLEIARGWRLPAARGVDLVADVLILRDAPPYGDVLPFYVAMLLASPVLLGAIRRGIWPLVAAASVGAFVAGQSDPWALSPRAGEPFPVLLWQAPFTAGLLAGAALPWFDALPARAQRRLALATTGPFTVVLALAYGPALGLPASDGLVSFAKVPLSGGECLRYVTGSLVVVAASAAAWPRLASTRLAAFAATLGRRSLALYVGHVFVQALLLPLVWYDRLIGAWQGLLGPAALALLWLLARALDLLPAWRGVWRSALRGAAALPAGACAAALLLASVHTLVPAPPDAATTLVIDASTDAAPFTPADATDGDRAYGVLALEAVDGGVDASRSYDDDYEAPGMSWEADVMLDDI